nr:PREDICTED: interleukin-27 subunit beta [Lepisosteus oculatus]
MRSQSSSCVCAHAVLLGAALFLGAASQSAHDSLPQLDVQCWSPSYPQRVLCTWKVQPEPDLPTSYTATYRKGLLGVQIPCEVNPERPRSCVMENLEMFSVEPYFVNVTATNALGSTTRLLPFILEKIVKPDPPVDIKVTLRSSRRLTVEWAPPPSWTDPTLFQLKYQVQYSDGGVRAPRTVSTPHAKTHRRAHATRKDTPRLHTAGHMPHAKTLDTCTQ